MSNTPLPPPHRLSCPKACKTHSASLPLCSSADYQPPCWELTHEGWCWCVRGSAIVRHQLVFGLLLSVLLAYIVLFCHKGVVESGMAEATELVRVSNVLVLFVRRCSRGGEGSRVFLWGRCFCRVNPNSWSVTEFRSKNQLLYFSQTHIKTSNTLHLNPKPSQCKISQ